MPSPDRPLHPLNILVVDDDADTRDSVADLLVIYGHTVRVARSGEDALRQADANSPDVVLLDILMPHADGCAVARALCKRPGAKRPILVAVTGCESTADRERTAAAGFDLHLVKPVDPGVLVGLLERLRRFFAPPTPAGEVEPQPEDPPDPRSGRPIAGFSRRISAPPAPAPTHFFVRSAG